MSRNGKIWFWTIFVVMIVLTVIILYQKTDVFKKIWEGVVWFYNWLRNIGKK